MTREQVELIRQRAEGCEQATLSGDDVRGLCDFALDHARREGVIEGLVIALQILDADHPGESQRIAAEIERLRGEA